MATRVFATDFDRTIADKSVIAAPTQAALHRLAGAGVIPILITGRPLYELVSADPNAIAAQLGVFRLILAENGSVLYDATTKRTVRVGPGLPAATKMLFVNNIATARAGANSVHLKAVDAAAAQALIDRHQLPLQMEVYGYNAKITCTGIDKGAGLQAALRHLGADPADAIACGDGGNDISMFRVAGTRVAVANAIKELRALATHITRQASGAGVAEYIDSVLLPEIRRGRGGSEERGVA